MELIIRHVLQTNLVSLFDVFRRLGDQENTPDVCKEFYNDFHDFLDSKTKKYKVVQLAKSATLVHTT